MNKRYHKKIADKMLANQLKMIKNIPNLTMFDNELKTLSDLHDNVILYGGIRPTKYVQSGNNIASFDPSSLATGREISGAMPHLVESGGKLWKNGRVRKGANLFHDIGSFAKTIAPIAKAAAPYALPLMMAAGLEKREEDLKR